MVNKPMEIQFTKKDILLFPFRDPEAVLGLAYIISAIALGGYATYNSLAENNYSPSKPVPQLEQVVNQTPKSKHLI